MGASSFGGINNAAVIMMMGRRGGMGFSNEPKPYKKFSWLWFSINLILFSIALYTLVCITCDFSKYVRVGKLYIKEQSYHVHKGTKYPEYYFTVKWNDRGREVETFEVTDETYFAVKSKENVYFKRVKPEYEWLRGWKGIFGLLFCGIAWVMSGIAALLKNE